MLENPATTVARYTLDVKQSFAKLLEDESGAVKLEKPEEEPEDDRPEFEDIANAADDEGIN